MEVPGTPKKEPAAPSTIKEEEKTPQKAPPKAPAKAAEKAADKGKVNSGLRAKLMKAGIKNKGPSPVQVAAAEAEKKKKEEEEARKKKQEEEARRRRREAEEKKRREEEERRRREEGDMQLTDALRQEGMSARAAELPDVRLQLEWA